MTIRDLQQALIGHIEQLFSDNALKTCKVFSQSLPPKKYENDTDTLFPYCVVSVGDGKDDQKGSSVDVTLSFGAMDHEPDYQGYADICHMVDICRLDLAENPWIEAKYEVQQPVNFTLSPDDRITYPYYFGGIWFTVSVPPLNKTVYNNLI